MVQLESGKYYKTRDGRKVGPMHKGKYGGWKDINKTITGQLWKDDGSYIGKDTPSYLDLVIEHIEDYEWGEKPNPRLTVHPAAASGAQREKLGTIPYDLVPFLEIAEAYSRVAEFGARKYSPWNWAAGLPRVQIIGSLLRHTWAYLRGEERDSETGLLHTDHILWNAVTLSHNVHHGLEDGRRVEPERDYKLDRRVAGE